MRNYAKFWFFSGHYDDGFGGTIILTNWFESEAQRDLFFQGNSFLNLVPNVDQHVWVWLNKRDVGIILNQAFGQSEYSPGFFLPVNGFSLSTPYGQWGLKSEWFVRADQDPIR